MFDSMKVQKELHNSWQKLRSKEDIDLIYKSLKSGLGINKTSIKICIVNGEYIHTQIFIAVSEYYLRKQKYIDDIESLYNLT